MTNRSPYNAVPAWKTSAPAASASSIPSIAEPLSELSGYRAPASTTVTAASSRGGELDALEVAPRSRGERAEEVALQTGQDRLGLGVAEAAVELEHFRSVRRQHQPGEEHADERRAAPRELLDDRLVNLLDELRDLVRTHSGNGREGAHAAGVRAGVAVADPLEVLRRRERHHQTPVGSAKTDTSSPRAAPRSRSAPGRPRPRADPRRAAPAVSQTKTPLPAASPSTLTTHGGRATASVSAVGTPAAARTALAKLFEPSILAAARPGRRRRPRCGAAGRRPGDEGCLRADHDEIDVEAARETEQALAVLGPDRVAVAERAIPGLPGAACSALEPRRLRELPRERMLAPARPDQEHLHGGRVYSRESAALGGRGGDAGECIDHVRVELRPRATAELLERFLGGASCAVGPVGRDRAVGVAAADDAGDKWDLVADEPVGVAAAAETLVTGADETPTFPSTPPTRSSISSPTTVCVSTIARSSSA